MKFFIIYLIIFYQYDCLSQISRKIIEEEKGFLNGTFTINSIIRDNSFFACENNKLIISIKREHFEIIEINSNSYFIICRNSNQILGIDDNKIGKLIMYSFLDERIKKLSMWKLINIQEHLYLLQNEFNKKYIKFTNNEIQLEKLNNKSISNNLKNNNYKFRFLKLYEEIGKISDYHLQMIENEPIDLFIKYIDLSDKSLNRKGIKQTYKDFENDELKYSLRSINEYLPWIRKIFIVMPNKNVRFLKPYYKIKNKIVYVNDKDFIGYDSANIFAFSFNLYKMEKFGISKNFIYMEDDYFIGKALKKSDFFYYDEIDKKIYPYVLNTIFSEMDKKTIISNQNIYKMKKKIRPHSHIGWNFSILNTDKYFLEKYKIPIISAKFTHCAVAENLDDLKEIFNEIQDYEYINETLFSKTRHVLTLNQPEFVNLYQLNIKHRKVNPMQNAYIKIENVTLDKLNTIVKLFSFLFY